MGEFNSDDHYIYYCGQESLRRSGVAITVTKRVQNVVLRYSLKSDRMIFVHFQCKPFSIMVIQVYDPTSNAENWTWMVLWRPTRPSRINTQKRCRFHYKGREYKSRKPRNTWLLLLLLLSRFSRVRLCATPEMAAHQAPPSLGFSRQEYWSGLPFPSPMHESEKWKWNRSVVSNSEPPHRLQPTRLLRPWDFPGKSTGVGCHCLLQETPEVTGKFGLGVQNEAGQTLIEFCQENALVIANMLFQQHKRRLYTWTSPDCQY